MRDGDSPVGGLRRINSPAGLERSNVRLDLPPVISRASISGQRSSLNFFARDLPNNLGEPTYRRSQVDYRTLDRQIAMISIKPLIDTVSLVQLQ